MSPIKNFLSRRLGRYPRVKMFLGLGFFEPFQYTVNSLNGQEDAFSKIPREKLRRVDNSITKEKHSDTLFVLGSGPSINSLSKEQFQKVSLADSMGFNFWMYHWFVPDFYILQMPRKLPYRSALRTLMSQKSKEYASCRVFLRGDYFRTENNELHSIAETPFGKKPYLHLPEFPISPDSSIPVNNQLRFLDNLGILDKGKISRYVPKPAGTLGLCISLALQMGYDNIVLLGVDMKDTRHFFDGPQENTTRRRVRSLLLPTKGTFMDKGFGASHKDWIIGLTKYLDAEKGTKIWLGTDGSSLSGEIDRWEW